MPDVVSDIVTQRWDHENKQFSLPPLMTLVSHQASWSMAGFSKMAIKSFYWFSPATITTGLQAATSGIGFTVSLLDTAML